MTICLGCFADRLGVGEELSMAVIAGGKRRLLGHNRSKMLTRVISMLAGGGEWSGHWRFRAGLDRTILDVYPRQLARPPTRPPGTARPGGARQVIPILQDLLSARDS